MSDGKRGAPEWIVTFSDIVSLLVTFFILILTWSTLEHEDFEMIRGSLQGALGVVGLTTDQAALLKRTQMRVQRTDNQGTDIPPEEDLHDDVFGDVAVQLKHEFGESIDFDMLRKGCRIRIGGDTVFAPGSAELSPGCRQALMAIARSVAHRDNPVRVEGHTDDRFRPSARYPTAWHLSIERAAAATRYLAQAGPVSPDRLSVAGYADLRPARPARSEAARARNRRVEVVILKADDQER